MEVDCRKCEHDFCCCGTKYSATLTLDEISQGLYKNTKVVPLTENNLIIAKVTILGKKQNGYCIHFDNTTKKCNIYESRPNVCKNFSCIGRIE